MAAVTVTKRRTARDGGNLKIKHFEVTVANDGDTLDTRLRKIVGLTITNPQEMFTLTGTLVAGTVAITDARVTTSCRAVVSRVSNAGTDGHLELALTASTATVTSSEAGDTSVVHITVFPPRVSGYSVSAGTITFDLDPGTPDVAGVKIEAKGF